MTRRTVVSMRLMDHVDGIATAAGVVVMAGALTMGLAGLVRIALDVLA